MDPGMQDPVGFGDIALILWKRRLLIAVGTIFCGITTLGVSLFLPERYEASLTLLLSPSRFSTELKPATLSVDTYKHILEADEIKARVMQAAQCEQLSQSITMDTAIYSSRVQGQQLMPVVELIVEAPSRSLAEKVVNEWSSIAVTEIGDISKRNKSGVVEFIRREYPEAEQRLDQAEKELKDCSNQFEDLLSRTEDEWSAKIAAFDGRWNLEALRSELAALNRQLFAEGGLIDELQHVRIKVRDARSTLAELKKEIKGHQQFLTVSKAITDDALWERIGNDPSGSVSKELQDLRLRSESLNPVYAGLAERLANAQVQYEALASRPEFLNGQIESVRARIAELNQLVVEKSAERRMLIGHQNVSLANLRRENQYALTLLQRKAESSRATFRTLSEQREIAQVAEEEDTSDLLITAPGIAPPIPVSPRPLFNTAVALVAGFILSLGLAVVLEFLQATAPDREGFQPDAGVEPSRQPLASAN